MYLNFITIAQSMESFALQNILKFCFEVLINQKKVAILPRYTSVAILDFRWNFMVFNNILKNIILKIKIIYVKYIIIIINVNYLYNLYNYCISSSCQQNSSCKFLKINVIDKRQNP